MYMSGATPKKEVNDFIKYMNQNKKGVKYTAKLVKTPFGKMYSITRK